jgi:hypothetical protein
MKSPVGADAKSLDFPLFYQPVERVPVDPKHVADLTGREYLMIGCHVGLRSVPF